MHEKFQMSSIGDLTFFLGLQVKKQNDGIFISQDKYVAEILKKFGSIEVKNTSTPMETQKPLLNDEDSEEVNVHMYRPMIGSLMYLTYSRPDIIFVVCACASYQVNPKCKKLTVVENSTTKAKYWLKIPQQKLNMWLLQVVVDNALAQNQLLDYRVDGKKVIISEASIRRDLQFTDEEGVNCLPNLTIFKKHSSMGRITLLFPTMVVQSQLGKGLAMPIDPYYTSIILQSSSSQPQKTHKPRKPTRKVTKVHQPSKPIENVAYEAVYKGLNDILERAANTASSLEGEKDSGGGPGCQEAMGDTIAQTRFENLSKLSNDLLLVKSNTLQSDEDRMKLNELMELCTNLQTRVIELEKTKTTQANEIDSLKRRVKKLEMRNKSRTHKLIRLYMVGLTARVESSDNEESLGKDASKQGRRIDDIDADKDITLVNVQGDAKMFDADKDSGDEECKKLTVVENSTTKAKYVAVSSCCGQVLWLRINYLIIEQFWSTVVAKNINGEAQIHARVDGKKVIISEASIRRDLQFTDEEGVDCLPNLAIFKKHSSMGYEKEYKEDWERFSGRITLLFPTMVVQSQLGKGLAMPTDPYYTSIILQSSSSQPQKTHKPRKPTRKVTKVHQPSKPIENVAYEAVYKGLNDILVRAANTASSLEGEKDSGGGPGCQEAMGDTIAQTRFENLSKLSNDLLLGNTLQSDEARMKLNELMELCTNLQTRVIELEKTKTTQANEIDSLKRRVKKLEMRNKSRTHKLIRLYMVGLTARVESLDNEESLGKDASKQGRRIDDIDADKDITLVNVQADAKMFDADKDSGDEEVFVEQEVVADKEKINEVTLAQALAKLKTSKPKTKGVVIQDPSESPTTTTIIPKQKS
nr:hypothetical protein [Tanacetum cinerariifolium]